MRRVLAVAVVGCVAVLGGCGDGATGPGEQLFGEAADASGDAFSEDAPDLTHVRVRARDDELEFTATFRAATLSESTTRVQFALDLDEDPSTGDRHSSSPDLGIEILVNLGRPHGNGVQVLQHDGTPNGYDVIADLATLQVTGDQLLGTVPSSVLDDDGRLAFRALASTSLGGGVSSGVQDEAPESEAAAARVR